MTQLKEKPAQPIYSLREEIVNHITHAIGAVLSLVGLILLVLRAAKYGDVWHVVSFSIYGSSLLILYTISAMYHSKQKLHIKKKFRILDHVSIYLLIAGSYTPFLLVSLRGAWGWSLFGIVWGLALLGIIFKVFFIGRFEVLATIGYVLMGWLVVVAFKEIVLHVPKGGITLLIAGGLTYTLGVVFYAIKKIPYNHAIWHLFVLGGSAFHFFAIYHYILPTI